MANAFRAGTAGASAHILGHRFAQLGPKISAMDKLHRFSDTRVTSCPMVMVVVQDVESKVFGIWNIDQPFPKQ
jgi:hypothetical protein